MKAHERWWQDNLNTRRAEFAGWLIESDHTSRDAVAAVAYTLRIPGEQVAVLEVGPGIYVDYDRLWAPRDEWLLYSAVDVTPAIVAEGKARGLTVAEGSIEALPIPADAVDLAYCRHVLEHLPTYKTALLELHRVARQYAVAVLWRLDPTAAEDVILYNTVADVPNTYHNTYSKTAISLFLSDHGIAHRWEQTAADWLLIMDAAKP